MNILHQRTLEEALSRFGFPSTDIWEASISELVILDTEYLVTFKGGWGHITDEFGIINKVFEKDQLALNERWHYNDTPKSFSTELDWNLVTASFLDKWYSEKTELQVLGFEDMPFRIIVSDEAWLPILHKSSGCSEEEATNATKLMGLYEITWNTELTELSDMLEELEGRNKDNA
jgi:hypothetical protein